MIGANIDTSRMTCRSPDSLCRWCNVDNASLKSDRFLDGPDVPVIIETNPQIPSVLKFFCLRCMMAEIFLRKLVHLDADFFISIMFELRCTKIRIVHTTMVDPWTIPLDASLSQIMGKMILCVFCSYPISVAMKSSLLNDVGSLSFKRCPHVQ